MYKRRCGCEYDIIARFSWEIYTHESFLSKNYIAKAKKCSKGRLHKRKKKRCIASYIIF